MRIPLALAFLVVSRAVLAQEFAAPAPPGPGGAAALLERALPGRAPGAGFEAFATRWLGLPDLVTTSAAASGSWGGARVAAGLSRTGAGEIGWSALGLAAGWASAGGGAAIRACARRYGGTEAEPRPGGMEAGFGAWTMVSPRWMLWASAPQAWADGEGPPLERRLELGTVASGPGIEVWLTRADGPGARGLRSEHAAGLAARSGPAIAWAEIRDRPPRGRVGLALQAGTLRIAAEVESHPVLEETVRVGLAAGAKAP